MVSSSDILNSRVLIVDDQEANVRLLERILLGAGYTSVASTMDPRVVCELHRQNRYDLILLDFQLPSMDGFQVMEARTWGSGPQLSDSNPRVLMHLPTQTVNGQPALALLFSGIYPSVLSQAIHGHEDVAVIKEATTLWNHKKGDFALPGTRRVKKGCASQAWAVSGRVGALVLRFFLGHGVTFMCLSEPSRAGDIGSRWGSIRLSA